MSPHYTDIIVLISEQDKEVPQQLLSDDQSNSYCIVLASLSAVCCYLQLSFIPRPKKPPNTPHSILATLLIYLLWLVVCIVHHRHHFLLLWRMALPIRKSDSQYIDASLPSRVDRCVDHTLQDSRRAIIKINPSWSFVLLIFLIDGTY